MNVRTALITTTINVPYVLTQWVAGMTADDVIIVAGDHKSPHDEIITLLANITRDYDVTTEYMAPQDQERFEISEAIGWNCIQRRNIALLRAMELKPKYILTIDDDNAPTHNDQVEQLIRAMQSQDHQFIKTDSGWYNPGWACETRNFGTVTHRGYPLSHRHGYPFVTAAADCPVGVAAMLWTGEPDIDAIERIESAPDVTLVNDNVVLTPGTWAPFNTQATMFRGELAPAMFMWPHVGRYDDIWASYLTRAVMDQLGWGAYYGHPVVHQDRNPHNLIADLKAEIFGMEHNETVIAALRDVDLDGLNGGDEHITAMVIRLIARGVLNLGFLSQETKKAIALWINDVETIIYG